MYIIDAYLNRLHRTFYGLNEYSQIKSNQIYLTTQKSKINKQMKMKK